MIDRLDLHAYADGELSAEERSRVEGLLADDPAAARELESIRLLKTKLTLDQPECASEWRACRERLDELDKVRKTEFFVGKYAWAICAVFLAVIVAGGLFNRAGGGSVRIGDVASYSAGMFPVSPSNARTLIGGPARQIEPALIVGAAYSDQPIGRVVRLDLRDRHGSASLMVIPNVNRVDGVQPMGDGLYAGQMNGLNLITWGDSGRAMLLIGSRSHEDLRELLRSLYR